MDKCIMEDMSTYMYYLSFFLLLAIPYVNPVGRAIKKLN